jgi:short-subunit dehydrogenase
MADQPVILITGASSGIGEATALRFARGGYAVVLAARRMDRLQALAEKIRAEAGEALPVEADLTRLEDIHSLVDIAVEQNGKIDVLFNNAGFGRITWLENLDPIEDIDTLIRVNLLGTILTTQAVIPHMIARRSGHIVNMSSMAGLIATPTYSIYAASKFGIRGFSESMRRELGVYNIFVSVIYPGAVETEFKQHAGIRRKTGITTPKGLRLQSEDVAERIWGIVRRPARSTVMPGIMRLAVFLNALAPGLVDRAIARRFTRLERGSSV